MIGPDPVRLRDATIFRTEPPRGRPAQRMRRRIALLIVAAALASRAIPLAFAQGNPPAVTPPPPSAATSPTVLCLPVGQDLLMPRALDASDGVLKGIISLAEEFQRLPPTAAGNPNCPRQLMRVYRPGLPQQPSTGLPQPSELSDPQPGPTLRARVGDLVQLTFVNTVDANRFDKNVVMGPNGCMQVGKGGLLYPGHGDGAFDKFPNCLHASSTANIHYHGTHTNPDATGDNVFLEILPLPRDIPGNLKPTPEEAMVGLDQFFKECAARLKDPLTQWPNHWSDMPKDWIKIQTDLLKAYQDKHGDQPILEEDEKQDKEGWPQYYIGVVPYCFALPHKPENEPVDQGVLRMGQAPGTHWYHSHKHGSTAINVMNGMTGAFIIEGQYDDYLNAFYGKYDIKRDDKPQPWNTRSQPVLVLNQLGTTPNLLAGGGLGPPQAYGVPFTVNGRVVPKAHMQPGEVQLWRIVNSSSRNAAYFMVPEGLKWRQLAQDGVQFAQRTYANPQNQNRPFYMAPANRVDLLVQAPRLQPPTTKATFNVRIQSVMARSQVMPTPDNPNADDPVPGTVLMTVEVSGDPVVTEDNEPMKFPLEGPKQPEFLADITDQELASRDNVARKFTFDSKGPASNMQHTINTVQFDDKLGRANVQVSLRAVEEWTIENRTNLGPEGPPALADHPFHIHINPYQITEVFDPNENLVDPTKGTLLTQLRVTDTDGKTKIMSPDDCKKLSDGTHCKTVPVPRYVTDKTKLKDPQNPFRERQCFLDPANPNTWSVAGARHDDNSPCQPQHSQSKNLIWWDTFAIPSARVPVDQNGEQIVGEDGKPIVIPGYFKMRSRFVDYHGTYVMHCHILIHEDRGMMFTVEVLPPPRLMVTHH
jgi:FtsP/CotA-like multicopper oxidase with cupredoxin domain